MTLPTIKSANEAELPAITIAGITKRFTNGILALAKINLEVASGSFVVILGPSGAGKSTLLRCVNGLETPSAGGVRVGDKSVTRRSLRSIRQNVAMVFQRFNLVGRLNVMSNVLCGRLGKRSTLGSLIYFMRQEDMTIANAALARVGLLSRAWERADTLSGGEQQRIGIARALAQEPKVLLADEPVASLDPATGEEIMVLLREIQKEGALTLLISLHQVDFARRYADRIIGLRDGEIVFDGPPQDLDEIALQEIYGRPPSGDKILSKDKTNDDLALADS